MKSPKSKGAAAKAGKFPIAKVLGAVERATKAWPTPIVTVFSERNASPYEILVSTIISLRTQDRTTAEASARIFERATTPAAMLHVPEAEIARLIYPAGFYKTKAATILEVSRRILDDYGGEVPDDVEELTKLKGVGRKTANLVVTLGHGNQGICVDTHVHRIANRWGYLTTRTPEETEMELRAKLPPRFWIPINDWLVSYGQNLCKPVSPLCSVCPVAKHCARVDVGKSR